MKDKLIQEFLDSKLAKRKVQLQSELMILIWYLQQFLLNMITKNVFLTGLLKELLDEQLNHEKNGDYQKAEECRQKFDKEKNHQEKKTLSGIQQRHKQQQNDLKGQQKKQLDEFNNFWDKKLDDFQKQSEKNQNDLKEKQNKQYQDTRQNLDRTLPVKVKESSQLLNLRKMQEHMAKQKNYPEAHKIQTKANKLYEAQKNQWDINRKNKIQTTLDTLKNYQNTQMQNLKQRNRTHLDEQLKDRKVTEDTINHKYDNFMNDLRKAQEKQVLAFKGEYRQLGGSATASSSPSKTKSSMGSTK